MNGNHFFTLIYILISWGRVSLCNSGWPGDMKGKSVCRQEMTRITFRPADGDGIGSCTLLPILCVLSGADCIRLFFVNIPDLF